MESRSSSTKSSMMVIDNQTKAFEGIRLENPFSFKVLQVFTGFGIGCGIGIGVPGLVNLGRMPIVGEVLSATRGATDAFSGVSRHVNNALRKFGAEKIQAGLGCGVGFGYGFGVGLAVKPSVMHQIQSCLVQAVAKLMLKFGRASSPSISQSVLPTSLQSGMGIINEPSGQSSMGNIMQLATKMPEPASQSTPVNTSFGRTENVLSHFLQNPLLREEGVNLNEVAGRLQSENNMLQMVILQVLSVISTDLQSNFRATPPSNADANKPMLPCTKAPEGGLAIGGDVIPEGGLAIGGDVIPDGGIDGAVGCIVGDSGPGATGEGGEAAPVDGGGAMGFSAGLIDGVIDIVGGGVDGVDGAVAMGGGGGLGEDLGDGALAMGGGGGLGEDFGDGAMAVGGGGGVGAGFGDGAMAMGGGRGLGEDFGDGAMAMGGGGWLGADFGGIDGDDAGP
ncbi:Dynamin [Citrus sinensis]|uniref:Dynamin n=1 Tax=Citrus sinensis TaxID=2711 RepID=A0ACB8LU05_CITSI|nr:Dynamin [Citrus sinensis]